MRRRRKRRPRDQYTAEWLTSSQNTGQDRVIELQKQNSCTYCVTFKPTIVDGIGVAERYR
jgi:hypothetical protein